MSRVNNVCPNCGGAMDLVNNQYKCRHCPTTILDIIDAKIDADVTVMSPDEFARKIEESKRQFVVNINDNLRVFDVNTMVINKKIQDATHMLEDGEFSTVHEILSGVPSGILSVERLKLLAYFKVRNEYELSFHDGYIDDVSFYKNIINLAKEETKETYIKLAEYCRERYNTKVSIEKEIKEVNKLLEVKLYQEAVAYTKEMCKKYPQTALSWAYACEVKCNISQNYNGNYEFSMMQKCPDFSEENLPKVFESKISNFIQLSNKYSSEFNDSVASLGAFAGCLVVLTLFATIAGLVWQSAFFIAWLSYVGALISFIASIVFICKHIRYNIGVNKVKKKYNQAKRGIPNYISEKYKANISLSKTWVWRIIIISCVVVAIVLFKQGIFTY